MAEQKSDGKASSRRGSAVHPKGYNTASIGVQNRLLVLKMIALDGPISRTELARSIGLTKTALGNIVTDLMEDHLISEQKKAAVSENTVMGRTPILLGISKSAPCICGILIKRKYIAGIISELNGKIVDEETFSYQKEIDEPELIEILIRIYSTLVQRNSERKVGAIGISCIGPIDENEGKLLSPPDYNGIHDVKLCAILKDQTGLPCFIINDSNAGALAEKVYGKEKNTQNFIYIHIMNGISAGYVLNHRLVHGDSGQAGEIGHSTINCCGPRCSCGNIGCLELYANLHNMNLKIRHMRDDFGIHSECFASNREYSWEEIIDGAEHGDQCGVSAVDEFCGYLTSALVNTIRLLNTDKIVVGYQSNTEGELIERVLKHSVVKRLKLHDPDQLSIKHSEFGGNAPLYGAAALIAELVFEGKLNWL